MSITVEFHEVVSLPHQQDIFQTTVEVDWFKPFANAFGAVHKRGHPGHHQSPFSYQYIVERPHGGGMMLIDPSLSPVRLGLDQVPDLKIWVVTRGD
ncbi:hypothetical protein V865_003004 [Kwoniella europaea PYCC6329]|uniref:Metallo-beta-lactamase domain-containing protein n=1 Tax=Kwoniella europaea PYCC6329 TaxID=1423913 RepID=A0AAX4KFZ7_9TREE